MALIALYRPGAMDQIPTYARGKRNPDTITYVDERLRPITEPTKGVILYQEQSMQIAKSIAGFCGPKADDLRKAIGKKNREAMAKLQPEFFEGCRRPAPPDVIETLWTTNEQSADYSLQQVRSARHASDPARRHSGSASSEAVSPAAGEIMSMWPDGDVRPHTGRADRARPAASRGPASAAPSGRQIKATLDHRLLTTEGYKRDRRDAGRAPS